MGWYHYPKYVPVARRMAKANRQLEKLKQKNPDIRPVIIKGNKIARTWWGKAWCDNMERYADFAYRIGRGRSYARNGMVLDLQIAPGLITSLVQGTASSPYEIEIRINNIDPIIWKDMKTAAGGRIDSLSELLAGKFPMDLMEIFTRRGQGLFPSPAEIHFSCSCPDIASMCKHVAATLYGVGARLDEDPGLFFTLRKADVSELVSEALDDRKKQMLDKAAEKSDRVLGDVDLSEMFGIALDGEAPAETPAADGAKSPAPLKNLRRIEPTKPEKRGKASKKKAGKASGKGKGKTAAAKGKAVAAVRMKVVKKKIKVTVTSLLTAEDEARKKAAEKRRPAEASRSAKAGKPGAKSKPETAMDDTEAVAAIICGCPEGITVQEVVRRCGLERSRVYNLVYKLVRHKRIKNVERGVYRGA